MLSVYKPQVKNKLRNINIAIAYHNKGRSMADVAREFGVAPERARQIHHSLVRHICRCLKLETGSFFEKRHHHCTEMARFLEIYKEMLLGAQLIMEIYLNDKEGSPGVLLSSCDNPEYVSIRVLNTNDAVDIYLPELKESLRKLQAK